MKDKELLELARTRFDRCVEAESRNRERAIVALEFRNSDQWPAKVKKSREEQDQPCLTLNHIPSYIRQVINDIRQIRPAIKVRPVDNEADPETAEVMNGMIKAIEGASNAEIAYDWAAEYAVTMGWGYFKITTDYSSDDSFEQEIHIKRIGNPFSVYLDPDRLEPDGMDSKYGFIIDHMDRKEFKDRYPKAKSEWDHEGEGTHRELWFSDDKIQIAEYWTVDETEKTISEKDGIVYDGEIENADKTRKVKVKSVSQRIITGQEVLEKTEWLGKYIPIIPVLGEELNIEGETFLKGMVEDLMDPQRQYNYFRSASTERVALAPKAPYIGFKGQFKSPKWRNANRSNYAYLEADVVEKNGQVLPLPQRQTPPDVSPGMANEVLTAIEDLKAISGIHGPGLGEQDNAVSGIAINGRKKESDVSNFHYVDNLGRAMRHAGRILVDLIPKIYDTPRIVTILKPDGTEETVKINEPYIDQKTQKEKNFNLQTGKYDTTVDIGPSYTTQRQEASEGMLEFLRVDPTAATLIGDLIARMQDWPESDEIAKRLRLRLPANIVEDENPQIKAIIQQFEQEKQGMTQYIQALEQASQQKDLLILNKENEIKYKYSELEQKTEAMHKDFIEKMTEFELKYAQNVPGSAV